MKRLVVLTGAAGAGKTTVATELDRRGSATMLRPFTTRAPRDPHDREYHFLERAPDPKAVAWAIEHGDQSYGMLNSELERILADGIGVTVFAPMQLHRLEGFRARQHDFEVIIVGLDTIMDEQEQRRRVGNVSKRFETRESLSEIRDRLRNLDVKLTGSLAQVVAAAQAVCDILQSRGGMLTGEQITPLIAAGSVLTGGDPASVKSASYDLRVGDEAWCAGFIDLTEGQPLFQIPPYSYAIVKAKERAALPTFMVGQFDLRVSLFLSGIILSNGPQVDPGYQGDLFCMLFNGNSRERTLRMGDDFCTIQFMTTSRVGKPYSGEYSIRERLRRSMPADIALGPGGAIFSKLASDIDAAKKEIRSEIPKDRLALYVGIVGILACISVGVTVWTGTAASGANMAAEGAAKAASDARAVTKDLKDAIAAMRSAGGANPNIQGQSDNAVQTRTNGAHGRSP